MAKNDNSTPNGNDLLTVREVAQILRVDDTTVRRWVQSGILEAITLPKHQTGPRNTYRIHRNELQKVFETKVVTR